jgi:hypothetical protein
LDEDRLLLLERRRVVAMPVERSNADARELTGPEILRFVLPRVLHSAHTLVREPFHRDGWVYEEKVDGWRMLVYKDASAFAW